MMICPACRRQLTPVTSGEIHAEACQDGCGGLWLDHHTLQRLETAGEGHDLFPEVEPSQRVNMDDNRRRTCPRCSLPMMRHFESPRRTVTLDECPGCGGVWLDPGELRAVVGEFRSPEERQRALDKYFYETFGERLAPLIRSRIVKNDR